MARGYLLEFGLVELELFCAVVILSLGWSDDEENFLEVLEDFGLSKL